MIGPTLKQTSPSDPDLMETASASYHRALKEQRKKRYSPPDAAPPPPPPQTPRNRVRIQPASPEVISSLITSLSAISSQAEHHFDNAATDDDGFGALSPTVPRTHRRRSTQDHENPRQNGFGVDYGAYKDPQVEEAEDAYFSDAAAPPVVRMAPPKAPQTVNGSLGRLSIRRSSSSLRSRSQESLTPSLSADPPPAISPGRSSVRKILRRSSKDSLNSLASQDRKTHGYLGQDLSAGGPIFPRKPLRSTASSRSLVENRIDTAIAETESPISKSEFSPLHTSAIFTPTGQLSPDTQSIDSFGGIGSGRPIPSRQSSLKHHGLPGSPTKSRMRSARHSRHSAPGTKDFKLDSDLPEEETEVVRRIRELQAAKKQRDQEFQTTSSDRVETRRTRPRQSAPSAVPRSRSNPPRPLAQSSSSRDGDVWGAEKPLPQQEDKDAAPSPAIATGKRSSRPERQTTYPPTSYPPTTFPKDNAGSVGKNGVDTSSRRNDSLKGRLRGLSPRRSNSMRDSRRDSGLISPRPSLGDGRPSTADSIDDAVDSYLSAPRLSQKVRHPQSGRLIVFSEVGDPDGFVVFCCVGMGLTRYLTAFYDELARTLRLRLITPDRPGVGESEPCLDGSGTPLAWPDDVAIICNHLKITKFSLLAHSAGAIYALATALRMPQQIRGRIHLLAPWIPPSQLTTMTSQREPLPSGAVPYSQKLLRALPTSFLKAANTSFMSATSASITSSLPKSPRKSSNKRRSMTSTDVLADASIPNNHEMLDDANELSPPQYAPAAQNLTPSADSKNLPILERGRSNSLGQFPRDRTKDFDERLTHGIWQLATTNSNPALDLVTCLERRRPIGFQYVDITRAVVIHHGSRDSRVPVENVKWLGRVMKRCEVRVLEGEGHGLMAVASVMGQVLGEAAREWEDWAIVTAGKKERRR